MDYFVFAWEGTLETVSEIPSQYWVRLWGPSMTRIIPPSLGLKHSLWWLFHYLGVFHNRDYAVVLIGNGDNLIHRSCIVPAYFRWPFMEANDCMISSTWTHPDYRGQGLATAALMQAMRTYAKPGRRFYYCSRPANSASIAVCRKAGFFLVGSARRTRRMGIRMLGQLIIESTEHSV